jgi:hypothetical protein
MGWRIELATKRLCGIAFGMRLRGLAAALEAGVHEFNTHSFDQTLVQTVCPCAFQRERARSTDSIQ